ncbi:Condensin complex subunit 3 [Grifola frondosa]|uniref:Condensin complex subunit 3 n=1 Tax=Grifola frondosa TaxID=5627 RepID=A0A1C7MSY5_GRIFR|nr:Condensin complex subunit 3 [Grifola frondosa]
MPKRNPYAILEALPDSIPRIFNQVQLSAANHRKNCIALHRLHVQAAEVTKTAKNGTSMELTGEDLFGDVFIDMVARILAVKKGPPTVERVIKFIGAYAKFLAEKDSDDDDDTLSTRFSFRLLTWLVQGFVAKEKIVRFRCIGLATEMIAHMSELDEDVFAILRTSLIERAHDKEPAIRGPAIVALSKLSGDPAVRKLIYSTILLPSPVAAQGQRNADTNAPLNTSTRLTHPRQLTLAQREKVLRHGLGDREKSVHAAAVWMISGWFNVLRETINPDTTDMKAKSAVMAGLIAFLKLYNVANPKSTDIAVGAVNSLFKRADILAGVTFDDTFWNTLTPESVLLSRIFLNYCLDNDAEALVERSGLQSITKLAYSIQEACNTLFDTIEELEEVQLSQSHQGTAKYHEDEKNDVNNEEDTILVRGFILGELLKIAVRCDFSDEMGRRKVFMVTREMLAHELFPEHLLEPCFDDNRGYHNDLREGMENDCLNQTELKSGLFDATQSTSRNHSTKHVEMLPEERANADMIDRKCLAICIAMLSRVNGTFDDNSTLKGILTDLIIPAVKRKELEIRERGLITLGLCCLIAKNMAMSSLQLFLDEVHGAPEKLKIKVLQVIFDVLLVYDVESYVASEKFEDSQAVQAILCIGICKLMLSGLLTDRRVLTSLVLAYVSPVTAASQEIRQCLAYFLPVYCYSSPVNQSLMQSIFISVYDLVASMYQDVEDGQETITPNQLSLLFVDWTDPRKVIAKDRASAAAESIHINLGVDILKALHCHDRPMDDTKELCQLLGKLYLPEHPDPLPLLMLSKLLWSLENRNTLEDPALETILNEQRYAQEVRLRELKVMIGLTAEKENTPDFETDEIMHSSPPSAKRSRATSSNAEEQELDDSESFTASQCREALRSKQHRPTMRPPVSKRQRALRPSSEDKENLIQTTAGRRANKTGRGQTPQDLGLYQKTNRI